MKRILTSFVYFLAIILVITPNVTALKPEQKNIIGSGAYYFDLDETGNYSCSTGAGGASALGEAILSLRYPPLGDERGLIEKLKAYINTNYSKSPFARNPQYVDQIFATSKLAERNINPLLVIAIAKQENAFGSANSSATANNNYFGITQGNGYRSFASVEEGIDYFIEKISRHVTNPSGAYTGVSNFYEYLSVHQVGLIAYPGEYPANAPGRNATPPYLTYDIRMDVYTSWDETRNSHKSGSPVYNPGIYYTNSINLINELFGTNYSTNPGRGANIGGGFSCGDLGSSGLASEYIEDCGVNSGNAAIACTAINQLMGIPYSQELRAASTDPDPQYLDCSALTGMAIYRTFGVDLKGMCSMHYLTNENFKVIDVSEILPGDIVGKGTICGEDDNGVVGHVAIVVSYDPTTKKLITVEASSEKYLSGLRGIGGEGGYNVGLEADGNGNYTWAVRYIGDRTLQPGALQ